MEHEIEYIKYPSGYEHIKSIDGIEIASDKHAYVCQVCGAIFQSKNMATRTLFFTDDKRCVECDKAGHTNIKRVCKCEPIV